MKRIYATTPEKLKDIAIIVSIAIFSLVIVSKVNAKTNTNFWHHRGHPYTRLMHSRTYETNRWMPSLKSNRKGMMLSWQLRKLSNKRYKING
jgi:hypothetical protein